MKRIAIIGAGLGGMAAAFDLRRAGHEVTIFEAANYVGGLAAGFKESNWDWSVERFYHHWFLSDKEIFRLLDDLGVRDQVVTPRPKTVAYYNGNFYPLDSPMAALTFPGYSFPFGMARFGFVTVFLRYLAGWRNLEKTTAYEWMQRYYGERIYTNLFEPMLVGKFGPHYKEVNMAWMWARLKARTTRLATFRGGMQAFSDLLAERLRKEGVNILLSTTVQRITPLEHGGVQLDSSAGSQTFDVCLSTTSPSLMASLAPSLPGSYLQGLLNLKSMGAVVMVLSLKQQISTQGYYWYNLPKTAGYPFLAMVEHTNFLSPEYFGGEHIVYCGDYLDTDHENFNLSKEELLQRFLPGLSRINPQFSPDWVRNAWLWRTAYAQPIPLLNHSANIPAIQTPMSGLYYAGMSQVYPWDRGTNFAVEIGRKAAQLILAGF